MTARNELASIVDRLSSIHQIFEHLVKAEEEERNRKQKTEKIPFEVTGTFRLPEALETKRSTDQERYHATQKVIAVAAWAAFVAALAYAVIAQLQLREMRTQTEQVFHQSEVENADASYKAVQWLQQLKIAQQQVKAAQDGVRAIQRQTQSAERAWITIDIPQPMITELIENKPVTSNIQFTNTGNTVARKIHGEAVIEFVKNGSSPKFNFSWDHDHTEEGLMLRNETVTMPATRYVYQHTKPGGVATVFLLGHDELQEYLAGKIYIAVYARVKYSDTFGVQHWTRRCGWIAQTPPPGVVWTFSAFQCSRYSNVDDNQPN